MPTSRGIDLRNADHRALDVLHGTLAEHSVVFVVRDQQLSPDEQVALTARLGDVLRVPFVRPLDSHPDVIAVLKEADERNISVFSGTWHSDFSFLDEPPSYTVLQSVELPPFGGDTLPGRARIAPRTRPCRAGCSGCYADSPTCRPAGRTAPEDRVPEPPSAGRCR